MDWVNDMVDGITSGLGVHVQDKVRGAVGDWSEGSGGRWSANGQNSSRIEQPEGEQYEFRGNRVVFSRLSGMHL